MEELILDFIVKMSLSLPIAVLVGVRAGRMLDQLHLHDMEEKISNLALEVLKEKIFNHLEILYQVYLETPPNIPTGVNFQAVSEYFFFEGANTPTRYLFRSYF